MATPEVTNQNGTYRYSIEAGRWFCVAGKIPGAGPGSNVNMAVHISYGSELTALAMSSGFTEEDFGKTVKVEEVSKKPSKKRRRKAPKKSQNKLDEVLFDFSE